MQSWLFPNQHIWPWVFLQFQIYISNCQISTSTGMSNRRLDFICKQKTWFLIVPNLMLPLTSNLNLSDHRIAQAPNLGVSLDSLFLTHPTSTPLARPISFIFTRLPKSSSYLFCSYLARLCLHDRSPKLLS